jgi:hypothetical protein
MTRPTRQALIVSDVSCIEGVIGEVQQLVDALRRRKAPKWTINRAEWALRAVGDLRSALAMEAEPPEERPA